MLFFICALVWSTSLFLHSISYLIGFIRRLLSIQFIRHTSIFTTVYLSARANFMHIHLASPLRAMSLKQTHLRIVGVGDFQLFSSMSLWWYLAIHVFFSRVRSSLLFRICLTLFMLRKHLNCIQWILLFV